MVVALEPLAEWAKGMDGCQDGQMFAILFSLHTCLPGICERLRHRAHVSLFAMSAQLVVLSRVVLSLCS